MHSFYVAEYQDGIEEFLNREEFFSRSVEEFEPNRNWSRVSVRTPQDQKEWLSAKARWLEICWEPNQDSRRRSETLAEMDRLEEGMAALEV